MLFRSCARAYLVFHHTECVSVGPGRPSTTAPWRLALSARKTRMSGSLPDDLRGTDIYRRSWQVGNRQGRLFHRMPVRPFAMMLALPSRSLHRHPGRPGMHVPAAIFINRSEELNPSTLGAGVWQKLSECRFFDSGARARRCAALQLAKSGCWQVGRAQLCPSTDGSDLATWHICRKWRKARLHQAQVS